VPTPYGGTLGWIQLLDHYNYVESPVHWDTTDTAGYVLDDGFGVFYDEHTVVTGNAGAIISDSPGSNLDAKTECIRSDHFKDFLMYNPGGGDSIYVPLALFGWDWQGHVERPTVFHGWTVTSGGYSTDPTYTPATTFPEWTEGFSDY
jgi:hypothetical protein